MVIFHSYVNLPEGKTKRVEMTESQGAGFEPDPVPKPSEFQERLCCCSWWLSLRCPRLPRNLEMPKFHEFDYSWLFIDLSCTLFSCLILFVCWCPHEAQFVQKPGCIPTMFCHSSPMPTTSPTPLTILGDHNSFHSLGMSKALGLVGGLWFSKQTITIREALGSSTKWFRVDKSITIWVNTLNRSSNVRLSHYLRWTGWDTDQIQRQPRLVWK